MSGRQGLFRGVLAGRGASLREAFNKLEDCDAGVEEVIRYPERRLMAARVPMPPDDGDGGWELINISDQIYVVITDCFYGDRRVELVPSEEFIEFHFTLVGPVQLQATGIEQVQVRDPLMVICRQGAGADYTVWCAPGPHRSISLYVRPDFLAQSLELGGSATSPVLQQFFEDLPERLLCYQTAIKVSVSEVLRQLMSLPYGGRRRLLYAEAKVTELLCLCVDELMALEAKEPFIEMFTARELQMFEEVRQRIATNFTAPPTISELARQVGTNTTKLKRGFKLLYGTTIFEFGHQHRMRYALHLLAKEKLPVGIVAKKVGYQHQASFASAFKEHFSLLPKEARRLQEEGA